MTRRKITQDITSNSSNGKRQKSRWWVAPDLRAAIESGKTFGQWLDGRIPVASMARISADLKKDKHGVAGQHAKNEREAARNNLAIVKYYEDNDLTAGKENVVRDSFELLVREVRARRTSEGFPITGVMCQETERLYRRAGDYERTVDALTMIDDYGILYESGNRRFIDLYSDYAEYEGLIGVARAKSEIRKISRRTRDSHHTRAMLGQPVGGHRRFGYLGPDKRSGRVSNSEKNPAEWKHLKWMIREGVAGKSWLKISEELNARGVRTAKGGLWKGTTVRDVVANPFLYGLREINDELVRSPDGKPVMGRWDKAGTLQQYNAIQERIRLAAGQKGLPVPDADFSPGSPSDRSRKYAFSGFLRCGRVRDDGHMCNEKMSGNGGHARARWVYVCKSRGDGQGCGGLGRDGERVDAYLTELVLAQHEKLAAMRVHVVEETWDRAEELAEARESLATFISQWRAKVVTDQLFYQDLPRLESDVKRLESEERKHAAKQQRRVNATAPNLRQRWASLDLAQKRAAIAEVLVAVIVAPLPDGAPTAGPFNPDLLRPVWRHPSQDDAPDSGDDNTGEARAA